MPYSQMMFMARRPLLELELSEFESELFEPELSVLELFLHS